MISDDGLTFYAVLAKLDGAFHARETDNRHELLAWIRQHCDAGDVVVELSIRARPPAVSNFLNALTFGAARLATLETPAPGPDGA